MSGPDDNDDDALRWAGDEISGREGARLPGEQPMDAVADQAASVESEVPGLQSRPGSRLITVGFGIVYLALALGWILSVRYTSSGSTDLLTEVLWQFGEFTAIVAAPLWFAGTLALTSTARLSVRAGWLALGSGLLLPWPLLPFAAVLA